MFAIQRRDLSEGNGALWYEVKGYRSQTRDEARQRARDMRAKDDPEDLLTYRVVEVGTPEFYSQPTDALEY